MFQQTILFFLAELWKEKRNRKFDYETNVKKYVKEGGKQSVSFALARYKDTMIRVLRKIVVWLAIAKK